MIKLINAIICNPNEILRNKTVYIDKKKFTEKDSKDALVIDLKGYTIYPALINSHDHLLGNYLPKVGNGPYLNWKPWDEDLKNSSLYQERNKLSQENIYELSYYRQLLSGTTTVSDHIPHVVNDHLIDSALIRIIKNYTLTHEMSSYELPWCDDVKNEIAKAKREGIPFITHIQEGYDEEAVKGVSQLHQLGGLFKHTVLVHCISCTKKDIKLISKNKSNVVWCPNSNYYMFKDTMDVQTFIKEKVNIALGTDSPMSGGVNLLDEMKFAKSLYKKLYKKEISSKKIFQMVTINAATAFSLDKYLGSIEENKLADILVVKDKPNLDPYDRIVGMKMEDIEFVLKEGVPMMGKIDYKNTFSIDEKKYQDVIIKKKHPYFIIGKPIDLKRKIDRKLGFNKELEFFPIEG